ncbi:MAG: S8 family serine peptidase [Acidobacteriota bacterium]|nr:S8 family serine peptidase [Acidobacteriota bacterium]
MARRSGTAKKTAEELAGLFTTITPERVLHGRTGQGVSVALVDSGVDTYHPSLSGRVKDSIEAFKENGRVVFRPSESGDAVGHGTACAGIVVKIASEVSLHSIKVLGPNASGSGEMFLAGLDYAIKQKTRVINLSLGTTKPELAAPLHDLLDRAYQAGCIVVAAANNLPQPSFPSIFSSSLVSVGKQEHQNPFHFTYRHGEVIELCAPGVQVLTTWPGGGFRQLTGNSFACPHIVGIIALILEAHPDLTPFEVKTILYTIARRNQNQSR